MHTRRTVYTVREMAVSLPFLPCLADEHPEVTTDAPPPAPPAPAVKERRGPNHRWSERPQKLTDALIRKTLGKPKPPRPDEHRYQQTMKRIARGGA